MLKYKQTHNLSLIGLTYTTLAIFGVSFSIGQYGIYVPFFIILCLQTIWDIAKRRKNQIQISDAKVYIIYILVFWICSSLNGDGDLGRVSLSISYGVCVLMFWYFSRHCYNTNYIDNIIILFVVILSLNCILTIIQYHNSNIGWSIWYFFNNVVTEKQSTIIENLSSGGQTIGKDYLFCPGIFPSQVYNGYIVSSLGVFTLYLTLKTSKFKFKILYLFTLGLVFYSLFVIQQRAAFYLFLMVAYVMFYSKNKVWITIISFAVLIGYILYGLNVDEGSVGRFADTEDKLRSVLYHDGIEYVLNHPLFGGRKDFIELHNHSVHNIFLNAFLYGGILGASLILYIYFKMILKSLKVIITSIKGNIISQSTAFAYALLIFNLISLTHNNSLLTGDALIWILYALLLLSVKYEKS